MVYVRGGRLLGFLDLTPTSPTFGYSKELTFRLLRASFTHVSKRV